MSGEFDTSVTALPWKGQYRPAYKLYPGENWRMVKRNGAPVECETAGQALTIARETVDDITTAPRVLDEAEQLAEMWGARNFRAEKDAALTAERECLFGVSPSMLFKKGGGTIPVETKRRRIA